MPRQARLLPIIELGEERMVATLSPTTPPGFETLPVLDLAAPDISAESNRRLAALRAAGPLSVRSDEPSTRYMILSGPEAVPTLSWTRSRSHPGRLPPLPSGRGPAAPRRRTRRHESRCSGSPSCARRRSAREARPSAPPPPPRSARESAV